MNKMSIKFCLEYLDHSVKEGFVDESFAEEMMNRPYTDLIAWTKENLDLGDAWAEGMIKKEL